MVFSPGRDEEKHRPRPLSRREFCGGVCAGAILVGCTSGGIGAIQTGGLNGGGGGGDDDQQPDASTQNHPDAGSGSNPPPDAASAATCTGTETDVGAPSTFALNTPKYFSTGSFFVVRDAQGLYALTAKCTHEGATTTVDSGVFYCPRHGAQFTFDGDVISGPVSKGLKHYSMCTKSNGNVAVNTALTVPETTRLDA